MSPQPQPACVSCGAALAGRFCSECGEEVLDPHHQSLRYFFAQTVFHGLTEVDGKIWRTLRRLMFSPGDLPAEYAAGRRRLYVNPLRLLVTAIIVYALATRGGLQVSMFLGPVTLSVAPTSVREGASIEETVQRIDRFGLLRPLLEWKKSSADLESESARERFHAALERVAEPLSFANVVMLAIALYAIFHRRRRLFAEHGAFSLHFLSFVLFSSLVFALVPLLMKWGWSQIVLPLLLPVVVWQFAYLAIAIRRFYLGADGRRVRPALLASVAALLIYLLNSAFITGVQVAGGAFALWRL